MTIRKAQIPGKTQTGAHAPLFLRITTPGETFLVLNEDSETGGWPRRRVDAIRAYAQNLNKRGSFWVVDSRSDGQDGYLVWLSWDKAEAQRRQATNRRRRVKE